MKTNVLSRAAITLTAGAALTGCVSTRSPAPSDPWEGMNRQVYSFNDTLDRVIVRPVATAYETVTPRPVRDCVHNIFSNVGDLWSATNSFLQGRGHDFVNTLGRFMFNTTMGIGGCFDVASANGAYKIPNDFGVTLGVWGFGQGPYLVLPIVGPSSVRDGIGLAGDVVVNPASITHIDNVPVRNSLIGLYSVDARAGLLPVTRTVESTALDPYSFVRDAYLQRRAAQVLGRKNGAAQVLPDYSLSDDADAAPTQGAAPASPPVSPPQVR